MRRATLILVGAGLLFAALGAGLSYWRTAASPGNNTATDALFATTMQDVQGQPRLLSEWKGQPLVVNFWATWCAPCVEEMPELEELQSEIAHDGKKIIGIGIDSAENMAQFAEKYAINYPLLVGGAAATQLAHQFGNKTGGLPYTVLIDKQGQVHKTYLGRLNMEQLRRDLKSM